MKRRRLLQSLAALPAVGAIPVPAQTPPPPAPPAASSPNFPITVTQPDAAAMPAAHFFTADQRKALEKLCDVLMPKVGDRPGAREAQAAAFLEFLISQSPSDRQKLYRSGLDHLNAKSFQSANDAQVQAILKPLTSPWTYNGPDDSFAQFLVAAKEDVLRATANSRAYTEALAANSRGAGGTSYYWYPVE